MPAGEAAARCARMMYGVSKRIVTIIVSDPWEFPDENEGRLAFVAEIVGEANGNWLLRLNRPIVYERQAWNFAITTPRYVGQRGFDKLAAANILFITAAQASDPHFVSAFDPQAKSTNPGVIGSVELGVAKIIPRGSDSYTEPTWRAKKRSEDT